PGDTVPRELLDARVLHQRVAHQGVQLEARELQDLEAQPDLGRDQHAVGEIRSDRGPHGEHAWHEAISSPLPEPARVAQAPSRIVHRGRQRIHQVPALVDTSGTVRPRNLSYTTCEATGGPRTGTRRRRAGGTPRTRGRSRPPRSADGGTTRATHP